MNLLISTPSSQKAIALSQLYFTLIEYQIDFTSNDKGILEVYTTTHFKKSGIESWKYLLIGMSGERLFNQAIQLNDLYKATKAIEISLPELLRTNKIEEVFGFENYIKVLKNLII